MPTNRISSSLAHRPFKGVSLQGFVSTYDPASNYTYIYLLVPTHYMLGIILCVADRVEGKTDLFSYLLDDAEN